MTTSRNSRRSFDDLITAAAGATIFATLGVCAHHDLLDDLNQRVRALLLRTDPRAVRVARRVTLLSESAVHPVLGFLLSKAASRILGRKTRVPLQASLVQFLVNKGTRLFVDQRRPPGTRPRIGLDRRSYPSGHTLAATAIAFATALQLAEGRNGSERVWLLGAAAAYAGTIGWTRLVLDQHWADDIVGAWAGGIALAILVHRAERGRRHGPRRRSYSRIGN
jgi:membrane-associated phospholipid phosphatase